MIAPAVAETVRQAVAAVRACDAATAALVGSLVERLSAAAAATQVQHPAAPVSPAVEPPPARTRRRGARQPVAPRASAASAAAAGVSARSPRSGSPTATVTVPATVTAPTGTAADRTGTTLPTGTTPGTGTTFPTGTTPATGTTTATPPARPGYGIPRPGGARLRHHVRRRLRRLELRHRGRFRSGRRDGVRRRAYADPRYEPEPRTTANPVRGPSGGTQPSPATTPVLVQQRVHVRRRSFAGRTPGWESSFPGKPPSTAREPLVQHRPAQRTAGHHRADPADPA
jgi:hypothetical protein